MAIQYIVGASGTGKTTYIYNKMINDSMVFSDNNCGKELYYLIPEQSNMAAEQDIVRFHPNGGTMDISIMSFSRLAFQIFDKENIPTKDILDDYGKSMLLMKVLKSIENDLSFYKTMIGKKGFVDEIKSIISEFYQYRITDEMLEGLLASLPKEKSLYYKIKDIKLIRSAFEKAMSNSYMVAEQLLEVFAENISASEKLKGAEIYFDGFTGFTPIQYRVIEELMKVCDNLYFSITIDADNNENSTLFSMGNDTLKHLGKIAADNMIKILPRISFVDNYRYGEQRELSYIERNLFRFPVREYVTDNSDHSDELTMIEADDVYEETVCVGRMIQRYVRDYGYHYRDIAVITGDLSERGHIWKQVMERMDIPYFMDANEPLLHNPITEIIVMLFNIFENDFSYDSVFTLLKTDITGIDIDDIYILENYVLKTGVRGEGIWKKDFRRNAKGFDLEKINQIRKKFILCIEDYSAVLNQKNNQVDEYVKAVYSFLDHCKIEDYLHRLYVIYEQEKDFRKAKVYENAYEKYIMVLDKTIDILGSENIERNVMRDILVTGISDIKLGVIPSTLDQIVIGDMERTRLHHKKILFMTGVNEGILPGKISESGLLNDRDRSLLEKENIIIAPDSKKEYYIQQFYIYLQLTQASERVILSYRKKDDRGNGLNISVFLKWIMRMFPDIEIKKASELIADIFPSTIGDIKSSFTEELANNNINDSSMYKILMKMDREELQDIIKGYLYLNQPGILNEKIARKLYSRSFDFGAGKDDSGSAASCKMLHSVSRLEAYSSCPYKFYLQYGLSIAKREEYKIETNHIGTILHAVMEEFFTKVRDGEIRISDHIFENSDDTESSDTESGSNDVTIDKIMDIVKDITIKNAELIDDTIFESSYRMRHQLDVLIRIACRSVLNLCRHLTMGDMVPAFFEKKFSPEDGLEYINMALNGNAMMGLNGIIDRVDIKETEDSVYVGIIDYKSSEKNIDFVKIIEGKQLQLAVYMSVIMELMKKVYPNKKIIPTGMFYFQLADKIADGYSFEEAEEIRKKKSRLTGLFNDDEKCLEHMDKKSGMVVSASYKNDGSLSKNKYGVTSEELNDISEYTRDKMIEIGNKIICGQIDMIPQKGEHASPCQYCDYKSICRFEAGLGGNSYGIGSQLDYNEAKEIVCGGKKEMKKSVEEADDGREWAEQHIDKENE